jgi:hypothetical protein
MPDEIDKDDESPRRKRISADDEDDYDRPGQRRRRRDEDEEDDQEEEGDATGGVIPYKNPKALLAYYFGIFSFLVPIAGGVLAIVLGVMGLKHARQHPKARGQAHASIGIGCGLITALAWSALAAMVVIGVLANKR